MTANEVQVGGVYSVNDYGDLYMDSESRPFVDRDVTVLRRQKDGMYRVRLPDGRETAVALRNISSRLSEGDGALI